VRFAAAIVTTRSPHTKIIGGHPAAAVAALVDGGRALSMDAAPLFTKAVCADMPSS
jgi:hypothetical protein